MVIGHHQAPYPDYFTEPQPLSPQRLFDPLDGHLMMPRNQIRIATFILQKQSKANSPA